MRESSLRYTKHYKSSRPIRIRGKNKELFDEGIGRNGIDRIEFRLSDIDPFDLCGISRYELDLIVAILFMCLVKVEDDIPDDPSGILIECAEVNLSLQLGVEKGINYYIKREKTGIKKSELVRVLIKENGYEGLLKLALEYGMKCGAEEGQAGYRRGMSCTAEERQAACRRGMDCTTEERQAASRRDMSSPVEEG